MTLPVVITDDMDTVRATATKCQCIGCGTVINEWQWCAVIHSGEFVGNCMCYECVELANMDGGD